ncbi:hypothetical protein [Spongiivirga citrea]|uniref:Outer membrane beta-barrel protein n=1 Tax=Spongiivirga citrea TaxID=1481457 RepID=A0A6M0CE00_9FLAO|nr:hypothetical protein [Spongiivirga citrea]NER15951.1 hypothetical protein [Spongiivirga citrea]
MQQAVRVLLLIALLFTSTKVLSYQYEKERPSHTKDKLLSIGYQYSFGEPNQKRFHLVDLNYQKSYSSGIHGSSLNWYIGNEFTVGNSVFLIGPKIGAYLSYGGIVLGSQMVYYTSFREDSLRYVPFFGIGASSFRLTINPHIRLTNTDFEPINRGSVNIVIGINLN